VHCAAGRVGHAVHGRERNYRLLERCPE
jgi:hypothetical protein